MVVEERAEEGEIWLAFRFGVDTLVFPGALLIVGEEV